MVAPWRNILTKSKQNIMPPSHNNDNSKNGCRGGMVAPWINTLDKSKHSKMGNWPLLFWGIFLVVLFLHSIFSNFGAPGLSPWTGQTRTCATD